ncbi:polysaccharide deacetylase family protein [Streptomyces sp. MTZ3.1]|uniref:Polysaccharide deacetylase family protein n=1 Tax=Streptomyces meridianus TaxID=2938945 RepID=A0ABT0XDT6_9ACTN|nr:polysaccharide deacetylase family protein [Streptomyces meridianus]MCM2579949.1 polysaccharide deacetylase family protein [Streptomyces meridianus]
MSGRPLRGALCLTAGLAAWHIGPAATWLPGVRAALPALGGAGDPRHVALTFDDGPDPRSARDFLRTLERLDVHATFFLLGSRLHRHPGIGRALMEHGHELAVHGWEHERPWLPRLRRDIRDVARAVETVHRVGGRRPLWYRPPYGILTGGRWEAARRSGLRPVLWTAWGRDWTPWARPDTVLAELGASLRGGGTVLLHDSDRMSAEGSWRAALGALPDLVAACRAAGLTVGPLAEHGRAGPSLRPPSPGRGDAARPVQLRGPAPR